MQIDIDIIRKEIDKIDYSILDLLNNRMDLVRKVGELKSAYENLKNNVDSQHFKTGHEKAVKYYEDVALRYSHTTTPTGL